MVAASAGSTLPAQAITFNHSSEAMYRAIEREPNSPYVQRSLASGLENIRMLSHKTPQSVREVLCSTHNSYHDGTGETWMSLLDVAEDVMLQWEHKANTAGITTRNAQYDSFLERFVFGKKQSITAPWGQSVNYFKVTSVLNNHLTRHQIKEDVRRWCNAQMNFSDFKLNSRQGWERVGSVQDCAMA